MQNDRTFNVAIDHLFQMEGGYVNDPNDRGGETKYGISKRAFPDLDIAALTKEQAAEIYYQQYWLKAKSHLLPPLLAIALFDAAVNHGISRASQFLQYGLKVKADGVIGPKTLAAARKADQEDVLERYMVRREVFYHDLVLANSTQARFFNGWTRRLFSLYRFIYTHRGELL